MKLFLQSFSSLPLIYSRRVVVSYKRKYVHELLVNRLFKPAHFLLECGDFSHIRNKYFHVDTIKQLFNDVPIDNVFLFLKEINLFNKL